MSSQFWNQRDHFTWIDHHSPLKSIAPAHTKAEMAQTRKEKKAFEQKREQLARSLVKEIDDKVMEGKLAASTAATGGIKLIWCGRLRSAAGNAHWTPARGVPAHNGITQHNLRIKLSPSILIDEGIPWTSGLTVGKLRNTLAHELCHCACFVIDDDRHSHHGHLFKRWSVDTFSR